MSAKPEHCGAYGYVWACGCTRLSDDVIKELGLEHGGGVVVIKRTGHEFFELMTDEQFRALLPGPDASEGSR